jgi:hypothetical protein
MMAMKQIQQQYRAVLSLRCFEELSYSDIAVAMQCSEVGARVLFFRAKQALKKQLAHQGLGKGLLLMCLGLFGKLTAPAEAASSTVTVTATSAKVGLVTAVIATAGTKLGIATVTAAAVGLASVGGISVLSEPAFPERAEVKSFHYTAQLRNNDPGAPASLSKGAYEQWFYCPEGIDGSMFMRMQRWDPQQKNKLCAWLENGQGNYYYNSGTNQVHINNSHVCWSSLKVRRLPTDTADFIDFLSQAEGDIRGVRYTRDRQTGLLDNAVDYRFVDAPDFRTDYSYNSLSEKQFQYDWPADIPIVDERDQMHARGWTYFRVEGKMDGQIVSGRGRIPFVYDAAKENPAWMILNIGGEFEIIDCSNIAHVRLAEGTIVETYPGGTFFQGLARPWMGMHTIDIVRRDAAEQKVLFRTRTARNKKDVIVDVYDENERPNVAVVYTIDMENDLIKDIRFDIRTKTGGSLTFSYLQDIDGVGDEFIEPAIFDYPQVATQESLGMLWLFSFAQGTLID